MSLNSKDINEILKSIEEERKELDVLENALKKRLARVAGESQKVEAGTQKSVASNRNLFELPPINDKNTLTEEILEILEQIGDREFVVVHIEKILADRGYEIKAQQPRARIAMALSKLEKAGKITKTHTGKGSEPNRYKRGFFASNG